MAMLGVEVVVRWGFALLVWLCLCCNLWEVWLFVVHFVKKELWWLCGVTECGFGHLIVVLCMMHKCGFVLGVSIGKLRG